MNAQYSCFFFIVANFSSVFVRFEEIVNFVFIKFTINSDLFEYFVIANLKIFGEVGVKELGYNFIMSVLLCQFRQAE